MKSSILAAVAVVSVGACDSGQSGGAPSVDAGVPGHTGDAGARDGSVPDGGEPSDGGRPPDGGSACASAPVSTYAGEMFEQYNGSSSYLQVRAEVTWTLASTEACVDRYAPSGLVYDEDAGQCWPTREPRAGAIEASDGELIVDRTTSPATYTVRGESFYETLNTPPPECNDIPPWTGTVGGRWADSSGSFDGALIGGGARTDVPTRGWHLEARDFTPPASGCSEPASDHWTSSHRNRSSTAEITWTRSATTGCVDRYAPSGTVIGSPSAGAAQCTFPSLAGTIEPDDGWLEIDRSTDPATLTMEGVTYWPVEVTCVNNQGEMYTSQEYIFSRWGPNTLDMAFDGDRWSGAYAWDNGFIPAVDIRWTFQRGQ